MSRRPSLIAFLTACAAATLAYACGPEGTVPPPPVGPLILGVDASLDDGGGAADGSDDSSSQMAVGDAYVAQPIETQPEWTGPCQLAMPVDVNLGNSPESFITAAYCQINGSMPSSDLVTMMAGQMSMYQYVRRIDVVRTLCQQAGKAPCSLIYSNPWQQTVLETDTCTQKTTRDVGAVMMFFFNCPYQTNCMMDWANTHAWGMETPDQTYGFGAQPTGYYDPPNTGFWLRELLDARHAGLQFVAPNEYGNDTGNLKYLEDALTTIDSMGGGMKVALFNDTSNWGTVAGGAGMNPAPDLSNTQAAAQQIYSVQWKPFFTAISQPHWYTVKGTNSPLIYFYNAGTLQPTTNGAPSAVIAAMKQLFQADFHVVPFVDVDQGYGTVASADAQFGWDTFADNVMTPTKFWLETTTSTGNLTFANSMVKWDSDGRDKPGAIATSTDRMYKDTAPLQATLQGTAGADLLLLETWNDLGEGTGITRNYDYYFNGQWQPPDAFMSLIRAAQCSN